MVTSCFECCITELIILELFTLVNFISNILDFLICLIFQVLLYIVPTFLIPLLIWVDVIYLNQRKKPFMNMYFWA